MHAFQFLHPELHRLRDGLIRLRHLIAARATEVGSGQSPATLADTRLERVRNIHETLLGKRGDAMRHKTVAFHLSDTKTAIARTTLARLARQAHDGTARTRVLLIDDHVLEALVERGSHEDLGLHHFTGLTILQNLIALRVHSELGHLTTELVDSKVRLRRAIRNGALLCIDLAEHTLHELRNRHTRRHRVRVHDEIRTQTRTRERHILLVQKHPHGALLTVARRELVTNLRHTLTHHTNLDKRLAIRVLVLPHAIHTADLTGLVSGRGITERLSSRILFEIDNLANHDIILLEDRMERRHAILLNRSLRRGLVLASVLLAREHELLLATRRHIAVLLVLVHRRLQTPEESTLDGRLVHDDGVLLIVATVARNGYDGVMPERQVVHSQNVHHACLDKRTARVAEKLGVLIDALGVIQGEHTHCLLAHGGLVGISRRLVVIRERDRRRHMTQDHVRVNFAVGVVLGAKILGLQSNEQGLGLCRINVLDTRPEPLGPIVRFLGRLGDLSVDETEHRAHETTRVGLNCERAVER